VSTESINEKLVRNAPKSTEKLLELLFDGLDWPRPADMEIEDIPLLDWSPDELHLDPTAVARLEKIQQLPRLTDDQPFGVFILSFDGGRLPVGAVRRLVNRLVRKKRAQVKSATSLWNLEDLIFFCQSRNGVSTLHIVAFRDTGDRAVMKVISWDTKATDNRVQLIARENLPDLRWPDTGTLDADKWREQWTSAFVSTYREGIRSAAALADKMARVAQVVRDEVRALYEVETDDGPLRQLFDEVKSNLRADLSAESFADMYAQTMVYGLLTARITHPEDFEADALNSALKFENPFLDALYSSFRRKGDEAFDVDEFGLHDLAEALAETAIDQVLADFGAEDRKDDPVVHFYEKFLERYAPDQRRELGTYYTPIPVVRFMVRAVDEIIKTEFGLPLGVADQTTWGEYAKKYKTPVPEGCTADDKVIRMIDPATGTGTYLLEWLRRAEANLREAGQYSTNAMSDVVGQMDAFEISLSSYAVAHLKTSLQLPENMRGTAHFGIRLTDTLAARPLDQLGLFGDDPIAQEGQFAEQVKHEIQHTVVLGNPPYKDKSKGLGPIVEEDWPGLGWPLLDDLTPAPERGLGAHTKILRNLYVFFWRWALHKAFGTPPSSPGIVAFITPSAWLTGPVFETMRSFVRDGHKVWIVDLNGDLKARIVGDENVFSGIQIGTAICIVVRGPRQGRSELRHIDLLGSRDCKFKALEALSPCNDSWTLLESESTTPIGQLKSSEWDQFVPLGEMMPFHANGIHQQRTWVNDPSKQVLKDRWAKLAGARVASRPELMKETSSKTVISSGHDLGTLEALGPIGNRINTTPASIVRYSFRTLDRQWLLADSRIIDRPSPELWTVRGKKQVFLNELHSHPVGEGPSVVAAGYIPNLDHFHGRGGRVIPIFRDGKNSEWNLLPGLLDLLNERLDEPIDEVTLISYAVGITAFPAFSSLFSEDLRQGGVRVPICLDATLIAEVAALGRTAIELFTYAERTLGNQPIRVSVRITDGPNIREGGQSRGMPDAVRYDKDTECLHLGALVIENVAPDVWDYQVTGMPVVKKWVGYRKSSPSAKRSSPLNDVITTSWPKQWTEELLDLLHVITQLRRLEARHELLLDQVREAPQLGYDQILTEGLLPPPKASTKPAASGTLSG
jgi:hypothetical protein